MKHVDPQLKKVLDTTNPEPRADFRSDLYTQVLESQKATTHKENTMKRNTWKWLFATPLVAGAAIAVFFGIQLQQHEDGTVKLSAQEVFAQAYDNFFEASEDTVRYQRVRSVVGSVDYQETWQQEYWYSGVNWRNFQTPISEYGGGYMSPSFTMFGLQSNDSYARCLATLTSKAGWGEYVGHNPRPVTDDLLCMIGEYVQGSPDNNDDVDFSNSLELGKMLLQRAKDTGTLLSEHEETVQGKPALRLIYSVPDDSDDEEQEEFTFEFVIDMNTQYIVELHFDHLFDSLSLFIEEYRLLDTPPQEFFTMEQWKKDLPGVSLETEITIIQE